MQTEDVPCAIVDLAFELHGQKLPRHHRRSLAQAVQAAWPTWEGWPRVGIHRLNVSAGGGETALVSRRTRLTLRVPRPLAASLQAALEQAVLDVGGHRLRLGPATVRELLPWSTLYAHAVVVNPDVTESAFLEEMREELRAMGVHGRVICGRRHQVDDGLEGYGLMVDQLGAADALQVMEMGLGACRDMGCGIFVPHKSSAAVGAPS